MLPQFPAPTPGFGVFNYWDTGFCLIRCQDWTMTGKFGSYRLKPIQLPTNQSEKKKKEGKKGAVIAAKGWQWGPLLRSKRSGRHCEGIMPSCRGCYAQTVKFECVQQSSTSPGMPFWCKDSSRWDISLEFFSPLSKHHWHYVKLCMNTAAASIGA